MFQIRGFGVLVRLLGPKSILSGVIMMELRTTTIKSMIRQMIHGLQKLHYLPLGGELQEKILLLMERYMFHSALMDTVSIRVILCTTRRWIPGYRKDLRFIEEMEWGVPLSTTSFM